MQHQDVAELQRQIDELQAKQAAIAKIKAEQQREQQFVLENKLKNAVLQQNESEVTALLKQGVRTYLDEEMKFLCKANNYNLIALLFSYDITSDLGRELIVAAKEGKFKLVKVLLQCNINLDSKYHDAIQAAIIGDHPGVLELLLSHATGLMQKKLQEIERTDKTIFIPPREILEAQVANIIDAKPYSKNDNLQLIDKRKQSLLMEAIARKSVKCAKFLIDKYKVIPFSRVLRIPESGQNPLNEPYYQRELDYNTIMIQEEQMYENKTWVSYFTLYWQQSPEKPIQHKSINATNFPELVQALDKMAISKNSGWREEDFRESNDPILLSQITNIFNCKRDNPLFYYYNEGKAHLAQGNALCIAIANSNNETAAYLIEHGIDIEEKFGNTLKTEHDLYGHGSHQEWDRIRDLTPLLLAAKLNNYKIVKLLLEFGADIKEQDRDGKSAMELTTDPNIKKLLSDINSHQARIARLKKHDVVPAWFCCTKTGKIMEDPIFYEGFLYDRKSYMTINPEYAKNAFTVFLVREAIEQWVQAQEKNAHAEPSVKVGMGMFR